METVVITGGSGTIGMQLSDQLTEIGYAVRHLSRSVNGNEKFLTFKWDLASKYIDPAAFEHVDHIIHLAGENVGEGRWTRARKKSILSSRVDTANLLLKNLEGKRLKSFISASGISYYGSATTSTIYQESDAHGKDFLAEVSVSWEKAATSFAPIADRVVMLRTGVVLSKTGGALSKMTTPIKWGIGSPLGSGNQYIPWLHMDDICGIYCKAVQDVNIKGEYNAVASEHITNKGFTQHIAAVLGKKLWAPKVPAFLLRLLFGEMSIIILEGSRINNQKIKDAGYVFKFDQLNDALKDIY